MDFNMMTRKRLNEAPWDRLIIPGLKWFPITDSAVSKFHINYRFYGLKEPDFVQYLVQWNQWAKSRGYSLRRVAYHSRAALMGFYPQEGNIERERF